MGVLRMRAGCLLEKLRKLNIYALKYEELDKWMTSIKIALENDETPKEDVEKILELYDKMYTLFIQFRREKKKDSKQDLPFFHGYEIFMRATRYDF